VAGIRTAALALLFWCGGIAVATPAVTPPDAIAVENVKHQHTVDLENVKHEHALALEREKQQNALVLSVIEKLVIGVVILLLGYLTNRAIERYRARSAFLAGYTDQHIKAISEAWRLIYRWDSAVRGYIRYYHTVDPEERHDLLDDLLPAIEESRRRSRAVRTFVDENRFWLGEELYLRFVSYHNSLDPYIDAVLTGKYAERIYLETRMYANKQDLLSLLRVTPEKLYNA
jgi:hypothetical protein